MRPLVATAGVALAVLLGATPAGRAGAAPGPVGPVEVTLDRSAVASVLGEHITVRSTVTNTGTTRTGGLIAHLDVVSLHDDVYVDPEDWSSDRSIDVESLEPGDHATLEWTVQNVNAGEFDVYAVVLPTGPPAAAGGLSVSPALRLTVASRRTLDPGGSLLVVATVPLVVGLFASGTRRRRRNRLSARGAL
jgi:hypothetical protein